MWPDEANEVRNCYTCSAAGGGDAHNSRNNCDNVVHGGAVI
jgi:hypothetical protein